MNLDVLYWAIVAVIFPLELDAVRLHEWRVLPLTSFMPERTGEQVFIWSHVPIVFVILWFSSAASVNGFRLGLAAFAMIHVGLHWAFRRHPAYEFNNLSSWLLIGLAGALGGTYLFASIP